MTFLTWHGTWFGRRLSDQEVTEFLSDEQNARHVQQALWQIGERIVSGDAAVKRWYPKLVELGKSSVTEIRQVDAMVMGQDNSSPEFHAALSSLYADNEPIVRRNAALSLIRFGDESGHDEILSIFEPFAVRSTKAGVAISVLAAGSSIKMGALLVRLRTDGAIEEIRSPLPGSVHQVFVSEGDPVTEGTVLVKIAPDPDSVWEGLRALYLIGRESDISRIEPYTNSLPGMPARIQEQARNTVKAIQARNKS